MQTLSSTGWEARFHLNSLALPHNQAISYDIRIQGNFSKGRTIKNVNHYDVRSPDHELDGAGVGLPRRYLERLGKRTANFDTRLKELNEANSPQGRRQTAASARDTIKEVMHPMTHGVTDVTMLHVSFFTKLNMYLGKVGAWGNILGSLPQMISNIPGLDGPASSPNPSQETKTVSKDKWTGGKE